MTAIEWTDATWNPTTGCDRVSPGCANCYALTLAARLKAMGQPAYQNDGDPRTSGPGFALTLHPDRLELPLRWRKPRMVFVNSMSDLFHEDVHDDFLARVWDVMVRTPQHTYQILTKRPERVARALGPNGIGFYAVEGLVPFPQPNIWIGTSIENARFTWRADALRATPAAIRFISAEPLLGSLFAERTVVRGSSRTSNGGTPAVIGNDAAPVRSAKGPLNLDRIDWLIAGGESGRGHRPLDAQWVRELRDACHDNGTAFFFKQWGGTTPKSGGKLLDGREWCEYPVAA